jgi:SAM-dependent methyltransferase
MTTDAAFERLIREALEAPFEGWNFSYLDGRKTEYSLPWDYQAKVREKMVNVSSMLDMGTGGGEIIASFSPLPPHTCATEGYAPNVDSAKKKLEPLGVKVYDTTTDQENRNLPFCDAEFELVINRHECYVAAEVWRVLRPGGCFLTQQCAGPGLENLIEWFKGKGTVQPMNWTAEVASSQLEGAGFRVIGFEEAFPEYSFLDVGAVVYYLRATPWLVDDFSVERYRDRLLAMHKHIQRYGGFVVKDQLFFIEATKPE